MPRWNTSALLCLFSAVVALSSCSPVQFSANSDDSNKSVTPQGPVTPVGGAINCNPYFNGGDTNITLSPSSTNPSLSANCVPTTVAYNWTVTRGNSPVTINSLTGATSTPNFVGAGAGTYLVSLNASAVGWTDYNIVNPLQVVVQNGNPPGTPPITCNPKLNGSQTSVTLSNANPTVSANCVPPGISYVWTVTRGGNSVTVAGLSGSSSTPDFLAAGPGTYQIYLSGSTAGYNSYTSTTPLTVIVPNGGSPGTPVSATFNVTASNNKLDILLVVDDSNSMLADNQRLASRLTGFVNDLSSSGFDWQMCVTLTRAQRISAADPNYYWGASYNWVGNTSNTPRWILKSGTANINQIFMDTINQIGAGWQGTDDERAIKAAWWHLWNGEPGVSGTSGCYRADAGLAVLVLSDEDERSIGGDQTQAFYNDEKNKPLETDDLPQTYVNYVKQVFGANKRFSVNSIIVQPGDATCLASQDQEGSKAHYGTKYAELSNLTNGGLTSICAADYSTNLVYFKDAIVNTQASVPLQCTNPVGTVNYSVQPPGTYTTNVDTGRLIFNPRVPAGSTIQLQYTCP